MEIDPLLLKAVCQAESSKKLDPSAFNYSDGSKNNHAFGICQVLYSTAKSLGLKDSRCRANFDKETITSISDGTGGMVEVPLEKVYRNCRLFGPYTNATYAAKLLRYNLDRYKGDLKKAIAAYNAGSAKTCKKGYLTVKFTSGKSNKTKTYRKKCPKGGLLNHYYVEKVLSNLAELKEIK